MSRSITLQSESVVKTSLRIRFVLLFSTIRFLVLFHQVCSVCTSGYEKSSKSQNNLHKDLNESKIK